MEDRRTRIQLALEKLVRRKRWLDFQYLALQLARLRWPDLEPTEWFDDGGEDAITVSSVGSDGLRRSLACSLSGSLEKVRQDCKRIRERGVHIDILVFYTPVIVTNLNITEWQEKIKKEYGHDLYVMPQGSIIADLEIPDRAWLCRDYLELDFSDEFDLESLATTCGAAASMSLELWTHEYGYDPNTHIQLTLKLEPLTAGQEGRFIDIEEVCDIARTTRKLILRGVPGAGKTITLLQIAAQLISHPRGPIPVLISLPHWASKEQDLLSFVAEESIYKSKGLAKSDLVRLNHSGRIIFLLNGWNEISRDSIEKTFQSFRGIVRNSPATAFVIATRESAIRPPLMKPAIVHIEPLDAHQRRAIIEASNISNVAIIIDTVEHQPAIEQITRTPLFLSGVIDLARKGRRIPTSRYGIIEELVRSTEAHPDHESKLISGPSRGHHHNYLSDIACSMCRTGVTNLIQAEALETIAKCSKVLSEKSFIGSIPHAGTVLETLVSHHLLVRAAYSGGSTIRFVHQQFQEWFASEGLYEYLVEALTNGHSTSALRFQQEILNDPLWEESLKFLAERVNPVSGREAEHRYGDSLVRFMIPLDLIFAAQLARLVGWNTLGEAREKLSSSLRAWYSREEESHKECALAAMLATGSPDFFDVFGPLLESEDRQVRLTFYHAWKSLPLSCLGEDFLCRIAKWPEDRREEFVSQLSWASESVHRQLAAELARCDPSPKVRIAALQMLAWSGAFEILMTILESEPHTSWPVEVHTRLLKWIPKHYLARIASILEAAISDLDVSDARCSALLVLGELASEEAISLMKEELDRQPTNDTLSMLLPHIHLKDPEWVSEWLSQRLLRGELWEDEWVAYLSKVTPEQLTPLGEVAFAEDLELNTLTKRIKILSQIAPYLTGRLLLLEFLQRRTDRLRFRVSKTSWDREDVLRHGLRDLPFATLVSVTLDNENLFMDPYSVQIILEIISPGSPFGPDMRSALHPEVRDRLRELIFKWEHVAPLEQDQGGRRAELAILLGAIGKPEDTNKLEQWLQDESRRVQERKSAVRWMNWYAGALARLKSDEATSVLLQLLSDHEYIGYASLALLQITRSQEEVARPRLSFGPDYRRVLEERQRRKVHGKGDQDSTRKTEFARAIHKALAAYLDEREKQDNPPASPLKLVQAAVALAQLGEEECIPILLRSGVPEALEALLLKGIMLPGNETLAVLDPIIRKIENKPWHQMLDSWYEAERCLFILLFSDRPTLGVERIRHIPAQVLESYHARNLVSVLGYCQAPEAADLLIEMGQNHDVIRHCMWEYVNALSDSCQPQGRKALIRLLHELSGTSVTSGDRLGNGFRALPDALARAAEADRETWFEIQSRCEEGARGKERTALIWTLEKLSTEEAALAACYLLRDEDRPHGWQGVVRVIENAMIHRIEAGAPNLYYKQPKTFNALRKRLMELALHDPIRKRSALALLASIEKLRLELGRPLGEPRHPDIAILANTDIPWPLTPSA